MLQYYGYKQVWFKSSEQLVSEPQVLEDIVFCQTPINEQPIVILSLNIGMLGPQSPLPSYFLKLRETLLQDDETYIQYIGFFDHILISQLLKQVFPELSTFYGVSWSQWQKQCLLMTNLKAVRNVHMIFAAIFPEYQVRCAWQYRPQWLCLGAATKLGDLVIGNKVGLGGMVQEKKSTLKVCLTEQNEPLIIGLLHSRLQQLALPLFAALNLPLEVYLQGQLRPLQLLSFDVNESIAATQTDTLLGYNPLSETTICGAQNLFSGNTFKAV